MARGERQQRFHNVSPSVWNIRMLNVFHKYVNLTESRGVAVVYVMVLGGQVMGQTQVTELLCQREV